MNETTHRYSLKLKEPGKLNCYHMQVEGTEEQTRHLGVVMTDAVDAGDIEFAQYDVTLDATRPLHTCEHVESLIWDIRQGEINEPPYGWTGPSSRFSTEAY